MERVPEFVVVEDAAALAAAAAERIVARLARPADRLAVCLTGGSTPRRLYELLATPAWRARIPWDRVHWFWSDERFVPFDDARNNARMAMDALLARVPVPAANIHRIPTEAADPHAAASMYQVELQRFYGAEALDPARALFDLVLLGVGEDGHIASLFAKPGTDHSFAETVVCPRFVIGVDNAGMEPFVPRVSLTFAALASTREMLFLVSGKAKRGILGRVRAGEDLPATHAKSEGEMVWLVDREAAPK